MTSFSPQRSVALDVFRGFAIAAMILVNTPGSWGYIYAPLRHAQWHGCTFTDLVFPFFLFATGAAMFFSLARHEYQANRALLLSVARRVLLLFLIGVLLNEFPFMSPLGEWRIPGVLQRIGLAYGGAALLILFCSGMGRAVVSVSLLLVYWWLLWAFGGDAPYSLETNLVRVIDIKLLGVSHLYTGMGIPFDPEGLLSTLPAIVSVVAGFDAARMSRGALTLEKAMLRLSLVGSAAIAVALLWNEWLPINKSLWTGSYVLYTSGICFLVLALMILLVDRLHLYAIAKPLQIYGSNPLFVYVASMVVARSMWLIMLRDKNGGEISLYSWSYQKLLVFASPINASLIFALVFVSLFWLISWLLYRRGILIKL